MHGWGWVSSIPCPPIPASTWKLINTSLDTAINIPLLTNFCICGGQIKWSLKFSFFFSRLLRQLSSKQVFCSFANFLCQEFSDLSLIYDNGCLININCLVTKFKKQKWSSLRPVLQSREPWQVPSTATQPDCPVEGDGHSQVAEPAVHHHQQGLADQNLGCQQTKVFCRLIPSEI